MEVEKQRLAVIGVELTQAIGNVLRITVSRRAIGDVKDGRWVGGGMRIAPFRDHFRRARQACPHRRAAGALWLEPDREFCLLFDDATGAVIDASRTLLDAQRRVGDIGDRTDDRVPVGAMAKTIGDAVAAQYDNTPISKYGRTPSAFEQLVTRV